MIPSGWQFGKGKNHRDSKQISGFQGLGWKKGSDGREAQGRIGGQMYIFHIFCVVVVTWLFTFVKHYLSTDTNTVWYHLYVESKKKIQVQFSCSVGSDSLQHHGLQHARPPCPSPTPGVYSNSCPLSQWCHPTTLSSIVPFSSHLQSFPASGSFQMSQLFESGG